MLKSLLIVVIEQRIYALCETVWCHTAAGLVASAAT
jgi:hypothetical protein